MSIEFNVSGCPVPKQSFRYASGGGYTAPRVTAWADTVAAAAREAMRGKPPMVGVLAVRLDFSLPHKRRVDADNLSKCVLDAMTGIVYVDDQQVIRLYIHIRRGCANPGGVSIEVEAV